MAEWRYYSNNMRRYFKKSLTETVIDNLFSNGHYTIIIHGNNISRGPVHDFIPISSFETEFDEISFDMKALVARVYSLLVIDEIPMMVPAMEIYYNTVQEFYVDMGKNFYYPGIHDIRNIVVSNL